MSQIKSHRPAPCTTSMQSRVLFGLLIMTMSFPIAISAAAEGDAWRPAIQPDDESITTDQASALPFDIRVRGGLWFAAPEGTSGFGRNASSLRIESDLDLSDAETSFTGDITIDLKGDFNRWQLWFDAFDTSQETALSIERNAVINGSTVLAGARVSTELSTTSFGAHAGYDLFGNLLKTAGNSSSNRSRMHVHLLGGVRGLNLDHSVRAVGAPSGDYDEWHAVIEAGGRVSILLDAEDVLFGDVDLSFNLLAGYGLTDGALLTTDVFTALTWKPTNNLGFSAGYRLFNIDLDDVDQSSGRPFEFDAYFAGAYFGAYVTF